MRTIAAHTAREVWTTAHIGVSSVSVWQLASAMDPRDRLWVELIYPHCGSAPAALLALRAVCRVWRAQLNNSRLWLPFTMELPRMRYDERVVGWTGIVRAMKREVVTRANCNAGHFTRGLVLNFLSDVPFVRLAGGRVAAFSCAAVQLFDVDTGARLASFDVKRIDVHKRAVLDRWIPFITADHRAMLLDCVAARLVEMAPADTAHGYNNFRVCGPCVSFHMDHRTVVVHVSGGPDGATVVRPVARVTQTEGFALWEGGRLYTRLDMLSDMQPKILRLADVATGQTIHAFTPRACVTVWLCCCAADRRCHSGGAVHSPSPLYRERVQLCCR